MNNFSGQDTRFYSKQEYDLKKNLLMNNLKNKISINNINNTNIPNNQLNTDYSSYLNNYSKMKENDKNFSISGNTLNTNNNTPILKKSPLIITHSQNIPLPQSPPQIASAHNRNLPHSDGNFNTPNNPLTNNPPSQQIDLHKILNKDIKFIQNPLPVPKLPDDQLLPPTSNDENSPYLAEIGDKRKLSNTIYNAILRSYKNIQKNTITEYEINHLLQKLNLDSDGNWSSEEIKLFSSELKFLINNKNQESTLPDNLNVSKTVYGESLFEKETKEVNHTIIINSADRDTKLYPEPSNFVVIFAPDNNTLTSEYLELKKNNDQQIDNDNSNLSLSDQRKTMGYIGRTYTNVCKVELLEVIIPNCVENGDYIDNFPYILLDIDELGDTYEGTNTGLSESFAQLSYCEIRGNFRYYLPFKQNPIIKYFNPRVELSKLTIKFKKPYPTSINNITELFNFGLPYDPKKNCANGFINYQRPYIEKEPTYEIYPNYSDKSNNYVFKKSINCKDKKKLKECIIVNKELDDNDLNCDSVEANDVIINGDNIVDLPCIAGENIIHRSRKYKKNKKNKSENDVINPNIVITLKITTIQRSLDTMYIV